MFAGGEQRGNLGKPFTYALRVPYKLIFLIARSFAYAAFPRYLESRAKREMHSNEIPFGIDSKLRICVCVCVCPHSSFVKCVRAFESNKNEIVVEGKVSKIARFYFETSRM